MHLSKKPGLQNGNSAKRGFDLLSKEVVNLMGGVYRELKRIAEQNRVLG